MIAIAPSPNSQPLLTSHGCSIYKGEEHNYLNGHVASARAAKKEGTSGIGCDNCQSLPHFVLFHLLLIKRP